MPPTPKVPRRVSTRGGVHLVGIVVFMLPGLMVALTQGVTWLMGRTFATGDVGTGYGIAMLICATGAVVLGWKGRGATAQRAVPSRLHRSSSMCP